MSTTAQDEHPPPELRVASLLPSATEIVCKVGGRPNLVGVSHECDYPAGVVGTPVLTSSKISLSKRSGTIDRDVRELVKGALGVYDIETDVLAEAAPDVIVTQDLCDVCAVSYDDVLRATRELFGETVEVVNLHPTRLDDIFTDIGKVAHALQVAEHGERVVTELKARVAEIAARAAKTATRPSVLTIEWIDPVMIGGTWMPELCELAGGIPLVSKPGEHAPTLDREALEKLAPDVVLIKPCGFDLARTRVESEILRTVLDGLPWPALSNGNTYVADGNAYFNRPGPRIVESLEILAACVHPEEFSDLAELHAASVVRIDSFHAGN